MLRAVLLLVSLLLPATALADKSTPLEYLGVAASIDGRFVAKWTIDRVLLSSDGGATFGDAIEQRASNYYPEVALADDGTLYVARDQTLFIRPPNGKAHVTAMKARRAQNLVVAGDVVVWLAEASVEEKGTFWVSTNGGRSFAARSDWDVGNFTTNIALAADGRIDYITGWEASCGGGYQARFRGDVAQATLVKGGWSMDAPTTATPTTSTFAYALDNSCGEGETLCAETSKGVEAVRFDRPVDLRTEGDWNVHVRSLGKRTLALVNHTLLMIDGTQAKVLADTSPAASAYDVTSFTGTTHGEAWAVIAGKVYRFARGAWTPT